MSENELIIEYLKIAKKRDGLNRRHYEINKTYMHITLEDCNSFQFAILYNGAEKLNYRIFDFTAVHNNTAVKLRAYSRCLSEKVFHEIGKELQFRKKSGMDYSKKYIINTHKINEQMARQINELVGIGADFSRMTDLPSKVLISAGKPMTLEQKKRMAERPYPNKPNKPHSDGPIMKVKPVNRMKFED